MDARPDETLVSPLARAGLVLAERYELLRPLGRGGMGEVWRARDRRLDRDVAVKLPAPGRLDTAGRERLMREARIAASLQHPGIVAVHDAGESQGQPYLVMELVEGGSLRDRAPSAAIGAAGVAAQVLGVLAHVHATGIVHRDLKPENLLWSSAGPDAWLKLTDLGIAHLAQGQTLTREGAIVGTAAYLAPEQALGGSVDGRADLYALGAMLHELVAGRPPFQGDNALAVISQHVNAPPPPLSAHVAGVDPALERFVLKLLQKSPDHRYATAELALAALQDPGAAAPPAGATLLDQLVRGRLVGRGGELERLRALWARAQGGEAQLALLSGEPGIGKSRLARELLVAARVEGAAVLAGGCYEFEATTPYLPFVEAITAWARTRDTEVLRGALGDSAADLARLVPELARLGPFPPAPALAPHEERLRLFEAATRFLRGLAERRGLLVLLDDLHWSDSGTLALVTYVLRQLQGARFMVLGAYREVELDRKHPLATALVDWERQRVATRIALGRLTRSDTDALLSALLGQSEITEAFGAALHAETEGNPFFVEEVVKALIDQGQIYRAGGGWQRGAIEELSIPQSVKSAIGRRLDRLTPACTDVLRLAAVLGKTFAFAELVACSETGEDALLDALDEAAGAQLLMAREDETFAFTHDKIREVLVEELSPIRRRRAHHRIAEALEARGGARPEDLAYHYLGSGDNAKALHWSLAAAASARAVYALEEAIHQLERARDCADAIGERTARLDVRMRLAATWAERGETAAVLDACTEALPLCETAAERVEVHAMAGEMCARVGHPAAAEHLEAARAEMDAERQPSAYVRVESSIARLHHYRVEQRRAVEILEGLTRHPAFARTPDAPTYVYPYLAGAYQHLAEVDASLEWAEKARAHGAATGDPQLEAMGHEFIAEDLAQRGWPREALPHAEADLRLGLRAGSLDRQLWAQFCFTWIQLSAGRLREALDAAAQAESLSAQVGDRRALCLTALNAARAAEAMGDSAAADRWVGISGEMSGELAQPHMRAEALHAEADVALQRADFDSARRLALESVAIKTPTDGRLSHASFLATAALACAGLGDPGKAERLALEALELCDARGLDLARPDAWTALARVCEARGDAAGARAHLERVVELCERLGRGLDEARAWWELAELLRRGGDGAGAAAGRARARDCARACEAAPLLAAIDAVGT